MRQIIAVITHIGVIICRAQYAGERTASIRWMSIPPKAANFAKEVARGSFEMLSQCSNCLSGAAFHCEVVHARQVI